MDRVSTLLLEAACEFQRRAGDRSDPMNTEQSVKLIKKEKRKAPGTPPSVQAAVASTVWSTAVHLSVSEFEKRRGDSLRSFASLFR